ncbi:MAG: ribulose-phosphate 3-epimerase [bacterium]
MPSFHLAPSILSANFANLEADIAKIKEGGCEYIHVDVMDGHFVPNITIGPVVIQSLRKVTDLTFDVHLMIAEPWKYIEAFANAGSDYITVHAEVHNNAQQLLETIAAIKKAGKKAGVSVNPDTPLTLVEQVIDQLDLILIMTVVPGFGGQAFMDRTEKIKQAKNLIGNRSILLSVDGGIKATNIKTVVDAGANLVVAGSAIFGNPKGAVEACRELYFSGE